MGGRRRSGLRLLDDTEWMADGVCSPEHTPRHDPNIWFPVDGVGVDRARRLCSACPVEADCLDYALTNRITHGVWGGESERSRRRLLIEVHGLTHLSPNQGVAAPDEPDVDVD